MNQALLQSVVKMMKVIFREIAKCRSSRGRLQTQRTQLCFRGRIEQQIAQKRNVCPWCAVWKIREKGRVLRGITAGIPSENIKLCEMPKSDGLFTVTYVQRDEFAIWYKKVAKKS